MIQSKFKRSLLLFIILISVGFSVNTSAGFLDDLKSKFEKEKAKLKKGTDKLKTDIDKLTKKKSSDKKIKQEEKQAAKSKVAPASTTKSSLAASSHAAAGATSPASSKKTKTDKSSSAFLGLPWSGEISAPINDVYGWFSSYNLDKVDLKSPTLSGSRGDSLYGTIKIYPFVFSLSGENVQCMESFNENLEHLEPGQTVEDMKSKLLLSELEKYESYKDKLVRFDSVRVVNGYHSKGQICLFSSIEKADIPSKTSISFTIKRDASAQYLNLTNLAQSSGIFYLPSSVYLQGDPSGKGEPMLRGDPIYVSCQSGYSWSSSKKLKAIKKRIEKGEFNNINSAEIELVGVSLTDLQNHLCTVDSINVRKLN